MEFFQDFGNFFAAVAHAFNAVGQVKQVHRLAHGMAGKVAVAHLREVAVNFMFQHVGGFFGFFGVGNQAVKEFFVIGFHGVN